ncbi:MAG TPA: GH92 family glycosyl hydrolase [Bacteroidia bacterium]|nr:GH92 family glycosyl hydrolase [Bacteroidia bacterium]
MRGLFSLLTITCFLVARAQVTDHAQYVKPMVGTGGHGHTFPGAVLPFGMVQLSPDTRNDGSWDGCSGYHHSDTVIWGFSHTHLSGTGCSDYGDILLMPTIKKPSWDKQTFPPKFSHQSEKASPGYYAVQLSDDKIDAELTATTRVGFHKYTFTSEGSASVFLDLTHRDKLLAGEINMVNEKTIEVSRKSQAWAAEQYIYARIEFSKPVTINKNAKGDKAHFGFSVKKGESILVKVSISSVDYEGAKKNMEAELPGWDFEKVKADAKAAWNKELGKIEVKTSNTGDLENFYTALYHCMIHPSISSDADMRYRGNDLKIHQGKHDHYTVFSLWDTFRGLHPLFTIMEQKRTNDFIHSFLDMYNEFGTLPVWELAGNETWCMIGYHSASVIADALCKGIGNFDTLAALNALVKSSNIDKFGIKQYAQKGYLTVEDEPESVSKTLEYAYDDWCIAQIAKILKKQNEYNGYMKRSKSWANVYDEETGFMRPRFNGGWLSPFDPREVNNHFTEANSWQYSFFVPQNIPALIQVMGGEKKFEEKLDLLFSTNSKTTGREQADITGLIGQYAQGNEPSHHIAYLYNYAGAPQKTQKIVHEILNELYKPKPDGLCGNEDCGQMSAWYVLSSMGFYSITPGLPQYTIGTCLFDEVKIHLENGKTFTIKTTRQDPSDFYVGSISLSNNQFQSQLTTLHHMDIMNGGVLQMNLVSNQENAGFGKNKSAAGPWQKILPAPVINSEMIFKDSSIVKISTTQVDNKIYYSVNKEPWKLYENHFTIKSNSGIKTFAVSGADTSSFSEGMFYKMLHPDWKVIYNSQYNRQYTGGGNEALIDGIKGSENWRKGFWQGFQGQDLEVVIDMGKITQVQSITLTFLEDRRSWIFFPTKWEFSFSDNNKTYSPPTVNAVEDILGDTTGINIINEGARKLPFLAKTRFIKIKAYNYGKLPAWHPGKGDEAFIFIDEIEVK